MATEKENPSAHITAQTTLMPAIHAWSYYLEDQGCSLHTIKAFTADIRLLAGFLAPDMVLGKIALQANRRAEARQHLQAAYDVAKSIGSRTIQTEIETNFGDMISPNLD